MWSRGSSWSRPALVMVVYLVLGAAALGWGSLRGHPQRVAPGGRDPAVVTGILSGLAAGLLIVFASRMALYRFEWSRALHRELRHLLLPLTDLEIVVLAAASRSAKRCSSAGRCCRRSASWARARSSRCCTSAPRRATCRGPPARSAAGLLFGAMFQWTGDLTGPVVALPDQLPEPPPRAEVELR